MSSTPFFEQLLNFLLQGAYPLLMIVAAVAGLILFSAEKRHFTLMIAIGASIAFFNTTASLVLFNPFRPVNPEKMVDFEKFFMVSNLVGILGHGMLVYGLLAHAIVFSKTRKLEKIGLD
ncbi:MAG: hypothetical protein HKN23_20705 [Verrucomicrobiales bacterium]|nr:hypothetical protein [Verrucomicrobiales bacterium]